MKLIVACDPKGGIGYENKLPWSKIEGDLPRFKALTTGKPVVMGRNTWESLPKKPLPNRINYVFSRNALDGAITLTDPIFLESVKDGWVIGGSKVIETCWHLIDEVHLTKTFAEYTCDTFIDLNKLETEFMCWFKEQHIDHTYEVWKRKS
jgi:dihydrofolate reductase